MRFENPDAFEVLSHDLLGRVGKLFTKSGAVVTPHLLPVVSPVRQLISPKEIFEEFHCNAIITNAYLLRKHEINDAQSVHELLGFPGVVVTDSGAYQILRYGDIDVDPLEIVRFQEAIRTDVGVILDIPTGATRDRKRAEWTVKETVERAEKSLSATTKDDILWTGPVQGGLFLDLLAESASAMSKMPFAVYAIGSPTPAMEHYDFESLVDMVMTARRYLPLQRPIHLFGAGHPMMFALAVAMGCDLLDSASYAIFARQGRYLTTTGTQPLRELEEFPCSCPECTRTTPESVMELRAELRERFLARHNLFICLAEIRRIRQAIADGRLWELAETQSRSHPALSTAFKKFSNHNDSVERFSPVSKRRGLFYFDDNSFRRPEVIRHHRRLLLNYRKPDDAKIAFITSRKGSSGLKSSLEGFLQRVNLRSVHVCFLDIPYALIPAEIADVYPLSQTLSTSWQDESVQRECATIAASYLASSGYRAIVVLDDKRPTTVSLTAILSKKAAVKRLIRKIHRDTTDRDIERLLCTLDRKLKAKR